MKPTSQEIALWAEQTFGPGNAMSTTLRAQREWEELMWKLIDVYVRGQRPDPAAIMDEVADIVITLARVQRFFVGAPTMEEAIERKMKINYEREWVLDGKGHGQHK